MILPRRILLKSSSQLALGLMLMHGAAVAAVWLSILPAPVQFTGSLGLVFSLVFTIRRHALRIAVGAVAEIELLGGEGRLAVTRRDGSRSEYRVHRASTLLPGLIVILLSRERPQWLPESVVILTDSIASGDQRALRAWLKWRCGSSAKRSADSAGDISRT